MGSRFILPARAAVLAFFASLLFAHAAKSHPSVGIVITPAGEVFYSDLTQVWRIAPDGAKRIAVPDVHTHELAIDSTGTIFGEDSEWLGGDRYRHRIWKRAPNGRISDIVPWRDGFWREYGFTRDATGRMYWVNCASARGCSIRSGDGASRPRTIVEPGAFGRPINWILASPAGEVYVIEEAHLKRVNRRGNIETVARISSRAERHHLMGMTLDPAGNVYVAAFGDRAVVRVAPSGRARVVARSTAPWAPSGVAVSPRGDLWILEWAGTRTRVRHLSPRGVERVY